MTAAKGGGLLVDIVKRCEQADAHSKENSDKNRTQADDPVCMELFRHLCPLLMMLPAPGCLSWTVFRRSARFPGSRLFF